MIVAAAICDLCLNNCANMVSNIKSACINKMDVSVGIINNTHIIETHTPCHIMCMERMHSGGKKCYTRV